MKLDDNFFDNHKLFDPLPDGVNDEEFFYQMLDYINRKYPVQAQSATKPIRYREVKLDPEYFEKMKLGDPLPRGMNPASFLQQLMVYSSITFEIDPELRYHRPGVQVDYSPPPTKTAGRPKRDYKSNIGLIRSPNREARTDRWLNRLDRKVNTQHELAIAARLEQYAEAKILTKMLDNYFDEGEERKLWRIYKAYRGHQLQHEAIDFFMEILLQVSGYPSVPEAKKYLEKYGLL